MSTGRREPTSICKRAFESSVSEQVDQPDGDGAADHGSEEQDRRIEGLQIGYKQFGTTNEDAYGRSDGSPGA